MPPDSTRYSSKPDSHTNENGLTFRRPELQGEGQSSGSAKSSDVDTTAARPSRQREQNRRTLRSRKPTSYVSQMFFDEQLDTSEWTSSMARDAPSNCQPERSTNGMVEPSSRPKQHRLRISREPPIPAPPAFPTLPPRYLQGDRVPVWLLNMAFVQSSEVALHSCQQTCAEGTSSRRISSPIRSSSPSKLHKPSQSQTMSFHSLPSQSQTTSFNSMDHAIPPSPEKSCYDVEEYREAYWSQYQYDRNAPHLEPHYIDREPPRNERWPDLDMQDSTPISEATLSPYTVPPLDVSSAVDLRHAKSATQDGSQNDQIRKAPLAFGFDLGLETYKLNRS